MEDLTLDIDSAEDIYGLSDGDRRLTIAVTKQSDKAKSYQLPLKPKLLERIDACYQGRVPPFRDLRECSEPVGFEMFFNDAWKAVERGSMKKLKDSIRLMKKNDSPSENCLDICCLQTTVSQISEKVVVYYMTLLAHAAVHKRLEMVKFLIKEGASLQIDNVLTGTPLTQLLVYSMLHGRHDIISNDIIKQLIARSPSALNSVVYYDIPINERDLSGKATSFWVASPLSFAILLQRFDIAALLTEQGADPLLDLGDGTLTCMVEYLHFGTNKFFSWLFQEHLLAEDIAKFSKQLLPELPNIFSEECIQLFSEYYKHPAHALLTCGNEEVVEMVLNDDMSLLSVQDPSGKTALQIAAGQGDVVSVKLLLKMSRRAINVKMNEKEAILAAAQNDHTEIVSSLLHWNFSLGAEIVASITSKHRSTELSLLSSIFEAFRDYKQELLLHKLDNQDNTIAHVAARSGNSKLFKVTFPLKSLSTMFDALKKLNKSSKTPLHLAIENSCLNILKTLKVFQEERRQKQSAEQKKEEREWKELWGDLGYDLLLHAAKHGSPEVVQIVFDIVQDCNLQFHNVWREALSDTAKTGKREMVKYLLNSEDISKNLVTEDVSEAVLLAASNGNTRCVELLLQQKKIKVDIRRKCCEDGGNCLMKAIKGNYKETVLTIVSHEKYGIESMQVCRHTGSEDDFTTPMRMLIVLMPDVAEWVLNDCAIKDSHRNGAAISARDIDESSVESTQADTYEFLEELCYLHPDCSCDKLYVIENANYETVEMSPMKATPRQSITGGTAENTTTNAAVHQDAKCCTASNHPLKLMVKHDREELLHHPLVKKYIKYKWFTVGIVGLIFYFALYLIFLSLLTTFALLIPRPSLENNFCADDIINETEISVCEDPELGTSTNYFLRSVSVILMLFSAIYLLLEALQFYQRRKQYLSEFENYIQVVMYSLTIIFVYWPHGVPVSDMECWCFPSWRWQIGAIALFLAWFNCCFLLKDWPWVGQPVTMLINVYFNFLTLVYLPILLILTFGFPLYMIHAQEGADVTFVNPARAFWNIILQTTGELDSTVRTDTNFVYSALTYILLILFIIAMPVLFNNFLIGMAVGETEEERKKASLTLVKMKVRYTFEVESAIKFLYLKKFCPCCHRLWHKLVSKLTKPSLSQLKLDQMDKQNKSIIAQMKSKFSAEDSQAELNALRGEMKSLKMFLSDRDDKLSKTPAAVEHLLL